MIICLVTPEFVTEERNFDGGLANYLYRLSKGLIELGHRPIIMVASICSEVIHYNGVEVHRVFIDHDFESVSLSRLFQSYRINEYITEYIKSNNVDIIQYTSYTAIGYYRVKNTPCVVRVSSYEPLMAKYYDYEPNSKLVQLEVDSMKNADAVFGPSHLIASKIEKEQNIPIVIIESPYINTVDVLNYELYNNLKTKEYLLFFGSLGLLKGVKTIADMLFQLFSRYNDLVFVFIGKDYGIHGQRMLDHLKDKAGKYADNIVYFDRMSHDKLFPFIINAKAVVLPSRIDNFPNTCIEAMACGQIVIGTRNTGFDQLINDGESGFLCERDNPESLLNTVDKTLRLEEDEIKTIKEAAINRANMLKPEKVIKQLVEFYHSTIIEYKKYDTFPNNHFYNEDLLLWDAIISLSEANKRLKKRLIINQSIIRSVYELVSHKIYIRTAKVIKNFFHTKQRTL